MAFFVLAGLSHLTLKKLNAKGVWSYCGVMFAVAVTLDLVLSLWSLSGYTSNYYSQTQIVENGSITIAGYLLQIKEALINGVVSSGVMAIFWFVAVFKSQGEQVNA